MSLALFWLRLLDRRSIEDGGRRPGGIASALNFPMMFLSGIFFSISAIPVFLTPIVRAMPLTYLGGDAIRQVMIGSTPQFPLIVDVGVLVAWTVVCSLLAARLFKWE